MGRPRKLDRGGVARAYEMSDQGVTGSEIAKALGVSEATISRLLARRPAREFERPELIDPDPGDADSPDAASDAAGGLRRAQTDPREAPRQRARPQRHTSHPPPRPASTANGLPATRLQRRAHLARRLNTYLADPDEYRAITRNLLHLGGTIDYQHHAITVTLDQPNPPRIAKALNINQLIAELNTDPPHLPGDRRPINYKLKC
jgi:hypothetical protein